MIKSKFIKSYLKEKIEGKYDAIVIGSGIGGMSTAGFLAKDGKKVLVLERHYTPGGFSHVYMRKGYEFDVGVHYIGETHDVNSQISKIFRYLTDDSIEWANMGDVYDRMVFGNEIYEFVKGKERFAEKMKTYFPAAEDQVSIDKYVELIEKAQVPIVIYFSEKTLPKFLRYFFSNLMRKKGLLYNKPALEVLQSITNNKKLIAVLLGQYGDYGMQPSVGSFMMHATLVNHYMNGGNYPVGGSTKLFDGIAPAILNAGGDIFVNAEVQEIIIENNKAVGVRLTDGKEIRAKKIISNAGVYNTYTKLIDKNLAEQMGIKSEMEKITPSVGHFCLYIGLRHSVSELKLNKANYWIFPDHYDHDKSIEAFRNDPESELPVAYISFPSAKDPDWERRYPDRSTIEIITMAPYEWFEKWEGTDWMKRGDDYEQLKEKMSKRLLEALFKYEPQLRDKIDFYELSTPLSTRHFVGNQYGELYGVNHDMARFEQTFLRPHTPFKNLFLTGQDIVSCGVAGAVTSGMITAVVVLNKNLMMRLKNKKVEEAK